ncbi:MAG: hypothetical protein HYW26_05030 [Candidatus Aenigmarchaeota archaeon]|nr:hypothetical protein [Candidatus Aenigmarchaeota archaeon]
MVYAFSEHIVGKIPGVFDAWFNVTLVSSEAYRALESLWESRDLERYVGLFEDPRMAEIKTRKEPYSLTLRREGNHLRGEFFCEGEPNSTRQAVFILSINPSAYASQILRLQSISGQKPRQSPETDAFL